MAAIPLTEMLGPLLAAGLAGVLFGAVVVVLKQRHAPKPDTPPAPKTEQESAKHESQSYFLMNETGNVLISTSMSVSEKLPEATLAQFSEALAHLAAVFFAITKSNDRKSGQHFSLYNYEEIKKALEAHPVFIRVSSSGHHEVSKKRSAGLFQVSGKSLVGVSDSHKKKWYDDRVHCSRKALRISDSSVGQHRLRVIHAQMYAEADRLRRQEQQRRQQGFQAEAKAGARGPTEMIHLDSSVQTDHEKELPDSMKVGHIILYCECLMGVSLVSLKLMHAYYGDYLSSDSPEMESDTYMFVSPSQLRKTMHDLRFHG